MSRVQAHRADAIVVLSSRAMRRRLASARHDFKGASQPQVGALAKILVKVAASSLSCIKVEKTPSARSAPSATTTATPSQVARKPADDADGADANVTPKGGRAAPANGYHVRDMGWQVDHFVCYFASTLIICRAWPRAIA